MAGVCPHAESLYDGSDGSKDDVSKVWVHKNLSMALCFEHHELAMRGLRKARGILYAGVWEYVRKYHPDILTVSWRHVPSVIRAGWKELNDTFWTWACSEDYKCCRQTVN